MPCHMMNIGFDTMHPNGPYPETADEWTKLLCEACTIIEAAGVAKQMPETLAEWWCRHKKADEETKAPDPAKAAEVLRRMTMDEASALGLYREWREATASNVTEPTP